MITQKPTHLQVGMTVRVTVATRKRSKKNEEGMEVKTGVIQYINYKFNWANVKVHPIGYIESYSLDNLEQLL